MTKTCGNPPKWSLQCPSCEADIRGVDPGQNFVPCPECGAVIDTKTCDAFFPHKPGNSPGDPVNPQGDDFGAVGGDDEPKADDPVTVNDVDSEICGGDE